MNKSSQMNLFSFYIFSSFVVFFCYKNLTSILKKKPTYFQYQYLCEPSQYINISEN